LRQTSSLLEGEGAKQKTSLQSKRGLVEHQPPFGSAKLIHLLST
jgi:hypothetical protein